MKSVAIIQARMGSSRLPGKVLLEIQGRSLLAYLIERLRSATTLDEIIVATTALEMDNPIVEECGRLGVGAFRGPEHDVLARYHQAARECGAGIVVRVTGDNPFTDPDSIDRVVRHIRGTGVHYAIETNLPVGTAGEALTAFALEYLDIVADQPAWREHVTLYLKQQPGDLPTAFLPARLGVNRPDLSFTVDQPEDYWRVRDLAEYLRSPHFPLNKAIELADETVCKEMAPVAEGRWAVIRGQPEHRSAGV